VTEALFPEERKKKEEEEKEKRRRLPTKEEILRKAIELYYKDHPEALERRLTPEELELRAEEGGYLAKAQEELMRGPSSLYKEQLNEALRAYRQEVENIVEELKRLGEKPEWPPPTPEELIQRETRLLNKLSALESQTEKIASEKSKLEEQVKKLQQELEKMRMPKEAPKPEVTKTELIKQARELWATYRNAILANDTFLAESTLKKLKEIRLKL
jgi:hypothetical protein